MDNLLVAFLEGFAQGTGFIAGIAIPVSLVLRGIKKGTPHG